MVSLGLDVSGFSREVRRVERDLDGVGDRAGKLGKMAGVALAVAVVAGAKEAVHAAMQVESAWADVTKTVSGSGDELSALRAELLNMAREIPVAATELMRIAASAGQLGIKTADIAEFTRVVADLGVATNLTGEEGATALAKFATSTGMAASDVDRLGAALVHLGNNTAATEAEIISMAQRLGGAGRVVGMTQADVLSLAAALSSVGIEAEMGGSAFSKLMVNIDQDVTAGGASLARWADVAGMTAADFKAAWERDAAGALVTFVTGLGNMQARGEDVFGVLSDLEITEVRLRDAVLRAATANEHFNGTLELGRQGWEENVALTREAAARYATTASQIQILKNRLFDVGNTLGSVLLPAFNGLLGVLQNFTDAAATASEWAVEHRSVLLGLAGAAAVLGATWLLNNSYLILSATLWGIDTVAKVGSTIATWGLVAAQTALSIVLSPFLPIVIAIGAAVGGLVWVFTHLDETIHAILHPLETLQALWARVTGTADENTEAVEENVDAWRSLETTLDGVVYTEGEVVDAAERVGRALYEGERVTRAANETLAIYKEALRRVGVEEAVMTLAVENSTTAIQRNEDGTYALYNATGDLLGAYGVMDGKLADVTASFLQLNPNIRLAIEAEEDLNERVRRSAEALANQEQVTRAKGETTDHFREVLRMAGVEEGILTTLVDDAVHSIQRQEDGTIALFDKTGDLIAAYREAGGMLIEITDSYVELNDGVQLATEGVRGHTAAVEDAVDATDLLREAQERLRSGMAADEFGMGGLPPPTVNAANGQAWRVIPLQGGRVTLANTATGQHLYELDMATAAEQMGLSLEAFTNRLREAIFDALRGGATSGGSGGGGGNSGGGGGQTQPQPSPLPSDAFLIGNVNGREIYGTPNPSLFYLWYPATRHFTSGGPGDRDAWMRGALPFARGGLVTQATHALIGEDGPEIVLPLSKPLSAVAPSVRPFLAALTGGASGGGGSRESRGPLIGTVVVNASGRREGEEAADAFYRRLKRLGF